MEPNIAWDLDGDPRDALYRAIMGGRHDYDSTALFSAEQPAAFGNDFGAYTLCLKVSPLVDGWLFGVRAFLDARDDMPRMVGVWETLNTTPLVVGVWRGRSRTEEDWGVSGAWANIWLHPQCRMEAGKSYFVGVQWPHGGYWFTSHRFDSAFDNGEIQADADNPDGFRNGAFSSACELAYPSLGFNASWYGIDVLFYRKRK